MQVAKTLVSLAVVATAMALSACAYLPTFQRVTPVAASTAHREMCVIEDLSIRKSFYNEYKLALEANDMSARLIPAGSPVTACPMTSTYRARWGWDQKVYLSYAELKVYADGQPAGEAIYDSAQVTKAERFIGSNEKIRELVGQLFPRPAKSAGAQSPEAKPVDK